MDLIFNEIMSHEFILNLNNLTETSVNESKIRFKAELKSSILILQELVVLISIICPSKDDFSSIWQFGETPQTN